jgi:preprotein translocase subunit SecE
LLQVRVLSPLRSAVPPAPPACTHLDRGDLVSSSTRTDASDARPPRSSRATARSGGPAARISRFFREVIAELGKVIWPTRKELVTYTAVVIVFVSIMCALVTGLDIGFGKLVTWVFG